MAAAWTLDERARRAEAEAGFCVVANMHKGRDRALIAWARDTRRFLRIDQWSRSEWANPFVAPDDGDREEVVGTFASVYLPRKNALLAQIGSGALRGKVLGCWCHPRLCHGHIIASLANRFAADYTGRRRVADRTFRSDVDAFFEQLDAGRERDEGEG